jgi:hypothetical protein
VLSASRERVPEHTAADVNRAIAEDTARSVEYFRSHRAEIERRLDELDREWDVERALATGSSCLSLVGLALGFSGRRRWFVLPLVVQSFYLQHTLQGWCPPLPVFRRLGFRTPAEIEQERCALTHLLESGGANVGRPHGQ